VETAFNNVTFNDSPLSGARLARSISNTSLEPPRSLLRKILWHALFAGICAVLVLTALYIYQLTQDPSSWTKEIYSSQVDLARKEGKHKRALELTEWCMKRWGSDPYFSGSCMFQKADILQSLGLIAESRMVLDDLLRQSVIDHGFFQTVLQRRLDMSDGDAQKVVLLEKLLPDLTNPKIRAIVLERLGDMVLQQRPHESVLYYAQAADLRQEIPTEHYLLVVKQASAQVAAGQRDEAWDLIERVIFQAPAPADRLRGFSLALKDFPEKRTQIIALLHEFPFDSLGQDHATVENLTSLEQALREIGEHELSLTVLQKAAAGAIDPGRLIWTKDQQLTVLLDAGRQEEALDLITDILTSLPLPPASAVQFQIRRADIQLSLNRGDEAIADLEAFRRQTKSTPESVEVGNKLAQLYSERKQWDKAQAVLQQIIDDPAIDENRRCSSRSQLASIVRQQGDQERALQLYIDVADHCTDPGMIAFAYESLAQIEKQRGDLEKAANYYRMINRRLNQYAWAADRTLWGLADLYEAAGKPEEALERLEELRDSSADPVRIAWTLNRISALSQRLGHPAKAEAARKRLLEEFPDTEPAAELRRQVQQAEP